jgi:hypothetical protein
LRTRPPSRGSVAAEVGDRHRSAADSAVGELKSAVGVVGADAELVKQVREMLLHGCV